MKVLCFDIGGTNIKYGVVEDYKIIEKSSFPTHFKSGHEHLTDVLLEHAKEVIKKYPDIKGVGISCAGSINYELGQMITPPQAIQEFGDWNFTKMFKDAFNLPIVADNDVNSFAACELAMGAGKKYNTFIVMTVGTGIGGAIIVNDTIWRGHDWNAGEIGRQIIDGVHWEEIASISAMVKRAKVRGLDVNEGKDVFDLYDNGDRKAMLVVNEFYQNLGKGIANLVYIFNPEAIVIGGGVSAREEFGAELNAYADYYLVEGFKDTLDIIPATYKNDGGMLGAYCNFVSKYGEK